MLIKEVIEFLHIDRETLRGWELGDFDPQVSHYPRIISFLGYNPLQVETETLSGKIRNYRYLNGFTQDKFAQLLGTDRSTVWEWESNNREPVIKTRERILNLINLK